MVQSQDSGLSTEVIELARMLVDQIVGLQHRIDTLDREIRKRAREDSVASRLMTVPGNWSDLRISDDGAGTAGGELCARP